MNTPDNVPVPDPSVLTTEALRRDISSLRELLEARMDGDHRYIEEKFRGVAVQIQLLIATTGQANDAKIDDIKARLDRGDGKIVGQAYKDTSGDRNASFVFSVIAVISSLVGIGLALVSIFRH